MTFPPAPGDDSDHWKVDTSYLPRLFSKRFSRLSKMALYVSYHCLYQDGELPHMPSVFCSRYGEFNNTCAVLEAMYSDLPVSPMSFSHSVYNTSQGLSSILTKDTSPSVMVSAGEDTLENAMVRACALLEQGEPRVLVVYHEDRLHADYDILLSEHVDPLALAFIVSKEQGGMQGSLTLSPVYATEETGDEAECFHNRHNVGIAKLLLAGEGQQDLYTSRLHWSWNIASAS